MNNPRREPAVDVSLLIEGGEEITEMLPAFPADTKSRVSV